MSQPTETTVRPDASRVRTVRMYDDAWDLIGDRAPDHSKFIRDMTDAGLGCARCWRCSALVPISFGDLTGKSLAAWIFEAAKMVTAQHRDGHRHITIGNGTPAAANPEPKADPGSAAAVPQVPASRNKRGRR